MSKKKEFRKADFPAAILAGGKSSRMGRNKAFLSVRGVPLILLVAATLGEYFSEVFVISNVAAPYRSMGLEVLADLLPGNDSLGGLHAAVGAIPSSHVFVTGCDMPFLQPAMLTALAARATEDWDVIIPIRRDYPEPFCAVYRQTCEPLIRARIERGHLKVIKFLEDAQVLRIEEPEWRKWDPEGLSFRNLNTPKEYEEALRFSE